MSEKRETLKGVVLSTRVHKLWTYRLPLWFARGVVLNCLVTGDMLDVKKTNLFHEIVPAWA